MKKINKFGIMTICCVVLLVVFALIFRTNPAPEMQDYTPKVYASVLSLLPPVVAIVLALVTKEVYSALFVGSIVGAFLYSGGNIELAYNALLYHEQGGLVVNITDLSHAGILVFVILLATIVVIMNKSGSATAFGEWASKHIHTRVGAQLATVLMGVLIFVDDGFNCFTVGSVMRPITDRHGVSRAKLAYLIDSTAAPICIIAPISSWAAAVAYAVPEGVTFNPFQMFIKTIPYNMYALVTILMVVLVSVLKVDFGPMKLHEKNALKGDLFTTPDREYQTEAGNTAVKKEGAKISNLLIPVIVLIVSCITGMVYTGGFFSGESFMNAFANADSAKGLILGSVFTLIVTFFLYTSRGVMNFKELMDCLPAGFRTFCAPMIILVLSWNLSGMTSLLGAADFIKNVMNSTAASLQMFLPFVVFLVSVFLAFATGTSWGTFTILIPIVCNVFPDQYEMLAISIAACLAGAVCGDHCSPISDTTIMSSAGAQSNHINHVRTQMPYAFTAAGVSAVGYLLAGIIVFKTESSLALIATPIALGLMVAVMLIIKKFQGKKELSSASTE
ncbi:MAG: Na+/H+ antiporter NhaC family protein [Clostridia bacterium]|nr:Na+/H+ antiporter NhaC family protein [Clostridia bacterium]